MGTYTWFYIRDVFHNRYITSGSDKDDSNAYHYENKQGSEQAMWRFEKKADTGMGGADWYRIIDKHLDKCITSGDQADNRAYLYKASDRPNEYWRVENTIIDGNGGLRFVDSRHGLYLAAPQDVSKGDHHLYHQKTNKVKTQLWVLEIAEAGDDFPDFYQLRDARLISLDVSKQDHLPNPPELTIEGSVCNRTSVPQKMTINREVSTTVSDTLSTDVSISAKLAYRISTSLGAEYGGVKASAEQETSFEMSAGFKMGTSHSNSRIEKLGFTYVVDVPAGKAVTASATYLRQAQEINYKAIVEYEYVSGHIRQKEITGSWKGVDVASYSMNYTEHDAAQAKKASKEIVSTT